MSKKISGSLKLIVPSCKANPSPPIGPALGQRGVNIMEFCKQFNEKTKQMKESIPLPVVVTVYNDRSFTFTIKKPSTTYLIKSVLGKRKQILASEIIEIAKYKNPDFQKLENTIKMIIGTLKSMAIKIELNL